MPAGRGMICGPVSVSSPFERRVVIAYTVPALRDIEIRPHFLWRPEYESDHRPQE